MMDEDVYKDISVQLVTANEIEADVVVSNPLFGDELEIEEITRVWIGEQGKHWPIELSAETLISNSSIELLYLPLWIVSGTGSAHWSASVGVDHQVLKRCSKCDGEGVYFPLLSTEKRRCDKCAGSGKALETETFWSSQEGVVETTEKRIVVNNFDNELFEFKCGDRKLDGAIHRVDKSDMSAYSILRPLAVTRFAGQQVAKVSIEKALQEKAHLIASGLGRVRNLQLAYVQIDHLDSLMWLYPIYLGYYNCEGEKLLIQIDGGTGKMWADVPQSVKSKRETDRQNSVAITILIITLACILSLIVCSSLSGG